MGYTCNSIIVYVQGKVHKVMNISKMFSCSVRIDFCIRLDNDRYEPHLKQYVIKQTMLQNKATVHVCYPTITHM